MGDLAEWLLLIAGVGAASVAVMTARVLLSRHVRRLRSDRDLFSAQLNKERIEASRFKRVAKLALDCLNYEIAVSPNAGIHAELRELFAKEPDHA